MSIVYLDLETADADRLWDYGPAFVRIAGYAVDAGPVTISTDMRAVVSVIEAASLVVGHNILAFDLPALELYYDLDLTRLVLENRVVDTLLVARQDDPPLPGGADGKRYRLDALCKRVLGQGKVVADGESILRRLAQEFGGYDRIPTDNDDYRRYLVQDVELVRELAKRLVVDEYLRREHQVMWRLNQLSRVGWRVDVALAHRLVAEQNQRIQAHKRYLHDVYGLPLEGKRPHASKAGKIALESAFRGCGVAPPRTPKGHLATSKSALEDLELQHPTNAELLTLCRTLRAFNGERSVAQTLLDNTGPDNRVHPNVAAVQAFGRFSVTNPGLTVFGKRDRSNMLERSLLLPDEGDVLITVDLSQVDARAMAMHAQDAGYIAALEPGKDLHDEMAAAVFGDEGWDRSGHHPRRGDAKAITHATSYGMGASGLAAYAGISVDDAQQQLAALDAQFPQLAAFKTSIREQAQGQVLVNAFGRRMRIEPGREYTKAPAAMGQGTARDLMTQGVLRLPEWLLPCLRAIVHDEIVLSIPESRIDEAETAVMEALQFLYRLRPGATAVPVLAALSERGRDWADCYREEKPMWPEVARDHREMSICSDGQCTWHTRDRVATDGSR